jgi:hypothetical protein
MTTKPRYRLLIRPNLATLDDDGNVRENNTTYSTHSMNLADIVLDFPDLATMSAAADRVAVLCNEISQAHEDQDQAASEDQAAANLTYQGDPLAFRATTDSRTTYVGAPGSFWLDKDGEVWKVSRNGCVECLHGAERVHFFEDFERSWGPVKLLVPVPLS